MRRKSLAGLAACGTFLAATGLQAGERPEDGLSEVLVTARKLVEPLDTIPLRIDVVDVRSTGITDFQHLAAHLPGLGFEGQFGAGGGVPTLRGQSQPTVAGDNVGLFVDGVYQSGRASFDIEPLDMERVELLRGPQSALFGHSSFAGALNYVSRSPTTMPAYGAMLESGSDAGRAAQGYLSGPLSRDGWRGRIALAYRGANGTHVNASTGDALGSLTRRAFVATLANPEGTVWEATLSLRHSQNAAGHPAVSALTGASYNCGSRDRSSRLWSYYCGLAPVVDRFSLSALPDSTSRATQAKLSLVLPVAATRFESDTSGFLADARIVRDFDASSAGDRYGVCATGRNCPQPGLPPQPVLRLVDVNQVLVQRPRNAEFSQEFRLRPRESGRLDWLIAATYFHSEERTQQSLGAARGDLQPGDLLTALLPASPQLTGPLSQLNRALVGDPAVTQVLQSLAYTGRRTAAVFGTLDYALSPVWRLRGELRQSHERARVDSRTANFDPGFGTRIPARSFSDLTPRASVQFQPFPAYRSYVSVARGSRSGGINLLPNLVPDEQTYAPETNWTWEWGQRYHGTGFVERAQATLYYIDWRNTQTLGYSTTPAVTSLITRNLAGVTTRGMELSLSWRAAAWLGGDIDASRVDARFRAGTDDPGSIAFCGLSATSSTSTFCVVGPPRNRSVNARPVVPWIDGNTVSRTPRLSMHGAVMLTPATRPAGWAPVLRADVSHQGNMYERGIEALSFGARTLLDARLSLQKAAWTIELSGQNLTDEQYIRSSFSRQPAFFPTQPRPLDMIYGEGRRIGLTLRYASP